MNAGTGEDIEEDIAKLIELYKKTQARGSSVEERATANAEAEAILIRLASEFVVGFFRLVDAVETLAREK